VKSTLISSPENCKLKFITIAKLYTWLMHANQSYQKTFAARFHQHLSESFLRLGFKKSKDDPELWMVDNSSYYESYVNDILIRSKDPMAVIKSLKRPLC
jgi:hypothetical protein